MVDVFLINPGDYSDFLDRLKKTEETDSFFSTYKNSYAVRFLSLLFDQINRPITAVLEEYYKDEDYLDLYTKYYVFSYEENSKFSKRILLVDCFFNDENQFYNYWYNEPENELSKEILAIFVIPETSNNHISKAYIDPRIILNKPCSKIILSNIQIEILGKIIQMNAFPFRQTDSDLLSCSEVSIQGVFDYFYNKNQGFSKERISSLLGIKQELSKLHGFHHGYGMDIQDICSVFRQKGYETVYYNKNAMLVKFTSITQTEKLVSMFYSYIASGYPCLLLVKQKTELEFPGHCIIGIGAVENHSLSVNNVTMERIESDYGKTYYAIQDSEYCTEIITVDDQTCLNYIQLSDTQKQNNKYELIGAVIALPPSIKMTAADAYTFAVNLMCIKPISALLAEENEENFIISIFLVKSTEYVRYRVKHAKELSEKDTYINYPMPDYVWVCEYSTLESYSHKLANAELVLDATVVLPSIYNTIVGFRSRNTFFMYADNMIVGECFEKTFKIYEPCSVYNLS